jgi:hypothetical protein
MEAQAAISQGYVAIALVVTREHLGALGCSGKSESELQCRGGRRDSTLQQDYQLDR